MGGREDVYRNEAKRESEERLKWKQRRGRNGEGVLVAWVEGRGGREICVNKAKKEKGERMEEREKKKSRRESNEEENSGCVQVERKGEGEEEENEREEA